MKIVVHPSYSHLKSYISSLPQFFDTEGEEIYRERNTVKRFTAPDGTVIVVKSFKVPNIIQCIGYSTYRPSKARRAYEFALKFLERGIDTPFPVAYIEERKGIRFNKSFFLSLENNDESLKVLRDSEYKDFDKLSRSFMTWIAEMHSKGIFHGDMNLTNFLFHEDKNSKYGYHFSAIDLNRSNFNDNPTRELCLSNLVRLSHDEKLLKILVSLYSEVRGWNAEEDVAEVLKMLRRFELRCEMKHPMKMLKKIF